MSDQAYSDNLDAQCVISQTGSEQLLSVRKHQSWQHVQAALFGAVHQFFVRAVIQDDDGIKLQVDVVGLDLTALIDTRQVVE